jgi:hypothetical protein
MLVQFQFFLQGKALEWYHMLSRSYQAMNRQLTQVELRTQFLRSYDPDTRNEQRDARSQLHNGSCTMLKYPTVPQYTQEFLHLCRQAADLSVTDQIVWFIEGLSNPLKEMCVVDANGRDWVSLEELMDYANGAEQKLTVNQKSNKALKSLNYVHPQAKSQTRAAVGRTMQKRLQAGPGLQGKVQKSPSKPSGKRFDSLEALPSSIKTIWRRFGADGNKSLTNKDGKAMTANAFLWHINNGVCTKCHEADHVYAKCPKK